MDISHEELWILNVIHLHMKLLLYVYIIDVAHKTDELIIAGLCTLKAGYTRNAFWYKD